MLYHITTVETICGKVVITQKTHATSSVEVVDTQYIELDDEDVERIAKIHENRKKISHLHIGTS